MITPLDKILPQHNHSRQKVLFRCDCGNTKYITWKNYNTNHTQSCGKCKTYKYTINNIKDKLFYKLRLDLSKIDQTAHFTTKSKVAWKCDCGQSRICEIGSVVKGYTKSCGCLLKQQKSKKIIKQDKVDKQKWLQSTPELIDENLPLSWTAGSTHVFKFKCKCGNTYTRRMCKFTKNSTCQKCDFINKEDILNKQFGDLTFIDINAPDEFHKRTEQKFKFKCKCGNVCYKSLNCVQRQFTTSCGECNLKPREWWINKQFGHLTVIDIPGNSLKTGSEQKIKLKCSCGSITNKAADDVAREHVMTCGSCKENFIGWWDKKEKITSDVGEYGYSLQNLQNYFKDYSIYPLSSADKASSSIKALCKLCNNEYNPRLSDILYSHVISCGCISCMSSRQAIEIGKFINSKIPCCYGRNEHKFDKYKADIYVNSKKLIIEHNGLRYHSTTKRTNSDFNKYKKAIELGYDYLMIYEDEWTNRQECFRHLILNKLNILKPKSLRPKQCAIKLINNNDVKLLYEKYHYQGHADSKYNIGVFYDDTLIAAMSIKRPTRQKSGDWEISRMACNFNYKVHGVWTYLLKWLKNNKLIFGKLISFSDNRLMSGNIYKIMGFNKESDVKPDYYWVKNDKRFHKSGLRKTEIEKQSGKTENELRIAQGYTKIYDLGKIKWSMII